jgi:biotin synthase
LLVKGFLRTKNLFPQVFPQDFHRFCIFILTIKAYVIYKNLMNKRIFKIADNVLAGKNISFDEVISLIENADSDFYSLLTGAKAICNHYRGKNVDLCAITNAKSGICPEDCKFCAQSSHFNTHTARYPLIPIEKMLEAAKEGIKIKARRFCIVISGKDADEKELNVICEWIRRIKDEVGIHPCVSLGFINKEQLAKLKEAGLERYHHNLETSKSFFPNICTTHTYEDKVKTIELVKEAGLSICCGGIFGMGEGMKERVELAFALKELNVDSIPINFLMPIPGTPLSASDIMNPLEALKTIAIFRYINPKKEIRVCGGREPVLRDIQSMLFTAGADGILIGNYLTTLGRNPRRDLEMIRDLGLTVLPA